MLTGRNALDGSGGSWVRIQDSKVRVLEITARMENTDGEKCSIWVGLKLGRDSRFEFKGPTDPI